MRFFLTLLCAVPQTGGDSPATARAVCEVLARATTPDRALVAPLTKELGALGPIGELLLQTLVEGRAPEGGGEQGESPPLSEIQERIVLAALLAGDPRAVRAFLESVRQAPEPAERVAAAVSLACATGRGDLRDLRALLWTDASRGSARVEDALARGLSDWMARERELLDALPAFCGELSAEHAGVVVRALAEVRSPDSARCLRRLLGQRDALEACVLQALSATADLLPRAEAEDLAEQLLSQLASREVLRVVAATTVLGRLSVPASIPALIELLPSAEPPIARATLAALRRISGTGLPASPAAWRRWYAAEERWWHERAPVLRRELADARSGRTSAALLAAALGELSEHPLYRDALAPLAAAGLEARDPGLRVLTCHALERLGSRAALPFLIGHLEDPDEGVAAAARRVLEILTRVELSREASADQPYLGEDGSVRKILSRAAAPPRR